MNRISNVTRWALLVLGAVFVAPAHAEWQLNMLPGVTDLTREVWNLHMLIFWICVVIGIGVFGAMLYSVFYHRKSRGVEAANFHESTVVEVVWTVVPFIILIAVAIPAAGTLLRIENSDEADMTIRVTGYQWLWEYEYVDSGVHFYSRLSDASNQARMMGSGIDPYSVDNYLRSVDNRLVVPTGQKVRLLLTSGDVIHSWWVPALGGKKDAIPGYINDMWFNANEPGVYRGQCAELCGRGHAFMPIVVEVVPPEQFQAWIAEQGGTTAAESEAEAQAAAQAQTASVAQAQGDEAAGEQAADPAEDMPREELMALGEEVYNSTCVACHQADGSGMEAAGFPAITGSSVATGPVEEHIRQIVEGIGAMPAFGDTLSSSEIAAVVTYERNALGNDAGDVVQPSQVASQR